MEPLHEIVLANKMPVLEDSAKTVHVNQEDVWLSFLYYFEILMSFVEDIVEVHHYVKLARGALSTIPKSIAINQLSQRLKEVYEYVVDENHQHTLINAPYKALFLVQQTIESIYFLREHGKSDPARTALKSGEIDEKVKDLILNFDHIMDVIANSSKLERDIVTLRISDVGNIHDLALLGEMPYALEARFLSAKCCLLGTRQKLVTEILDWVNNHDSGRVLLLLGQAGTGKSAVAHTVSEIFMEQNRLGSFFRFSQSYKDRRNLLFSTISRNFADGDVQWREHLVEIIKEDSIRTSKDLVTQFDELIVKPSRAVNTMGPVVIVIDGLDESGDRKERATLLNLLLERSSELPRNYRFLITSRPQPDIMCWCEHPNVLRKCMDDLDLDKTTDDIRQYISSRFYLVDDIVDGELHEDWRLALAKKAKGHFQWASTVCNCIHLTVGSGLSKRVQAFISGPTLPLYQLYHNVLLRQTDFNQPEYLAAFKTIMGVLLTMREPLSIEPLQALLQEKIWFSVESFIRPFLPLFPDVGPIQPLHASMIDFLRTPFIDIVDKNEKVETIPNRFYVDTSDQQYLTLACLKLLNNQKLGFIFYGGPVSHLERQRAIPACVRYAVCFWAVHLQQSSMSEALLEQLRILMRTNQFYLFVISNLFQENDQACTSMQILADWCEAVDYELAETAEDARQFGYEVRDGKHTTMLNEVGGVCTAL